MGDAPDMVANLSGCNGEAMTWTMGVAPGSAVDCDYDYEEERMY